MRLSHQAQALVQETEENFPVASFFLPENARTPILNFYSFARHADNIADSPSLTAEVKIEQLSALLKCLETATPCPSWAEAHMRDIAAGKVQLIHATHLLKAFLQDAIKNRYASYEELIEYCKFSAAPVGRAVLEICGEKGADFAAADALCIALQLLNHLQDCGKDYRTLNRVYIPQKWLQDFNVADSALASRSSPPELMQIYQEYLYQCRLLLNRAQSLPKTIASKKLRMELGFILELAWALEARLRHRDPLAQIIKVPLIFWPYYACKAWIRAW